MARSERPRSIAPDTGGEDVAAWAAGRIAHEDRPDATSFEWSIVAVERPCCDPWSVHDPTTVYDRSVDRGFGVDGRARSFTEF